MLNKKVYFFAILTLFIISLSIEAYAEQITVYTARGRTLTRIPFNKYWRETGVRIQVVEGNIDELLEKIRKEGEQSPADILLTVDAGSLWEATNAGYFQPITSAILDKNIPPHLRDPEKHWFALSKRARTIVYSTERVTTKELSTYKNLAHPKWKNRLCLRTSKKVYNQSLVAMMIAQHGVDETVKILKGWVSNLAEPPFNKEVALFWPNQGENEGGVYIDISGAGILKNAKNKGEAVRFLEWLSSEKAQNLFADSNMEYPVNPNVNPDQLVQSWGDFKHNTEHILQSGKYREEAIRLMNKVNYK